MYQGIDHDGCHYVQYNSKATSQVILSYGRVMSDTYIESPYFSKGTIQKFITHCYTLVHDTAGKNNPLQWFSSLRVCFTVLAKYTKLLKSP